jgi:prepilin-type N-terminal cleavage/methylation domain-containing protein
MKHRTRGFTLIELLVVIAIIGILASIVLVSLNSARNKGKDARIIADVQQTRSIFETGYNGSAYPDLYNWNNLNCNGGVANNIAVGTFVNCVNAAGPGNTALGTLNTDASTQGGGLFVTLGGNATIVNAYAIRGQLVSSTTQYFCIDSTGKTNTADNNANASAVTCH